MMASTVQNDTFGEITREELAELRATAKKCTTCGMLATVDPVLHTNRYGHAAQFRDEDGQVWAWDSNTARWVAQAGD